MIRTVVLRVAALAILLLLVLVAAITVRTLRRLPNTLIYLVRTEDTRFGLEQVPRRTRARNSEERVRATIEALAEGPTAGEAQRGLSTAIPQGIRVWGAELQGETLRLDLSTEFEEGASGATLIARLQQLLYTLTQPNSVAAVALSINGRPVTLLGTDGLLVENPWRRSDHPASPTW